MSFFFSMLLIMVLITFPLFTVIFCFMWWTRGKGFGEFRDFFRPKRAPRTAEVPLPADPTGPTAKP